MNAHTPGPWRLLPFDEDGRCLGIVGPDGRAIVRTDSGVYPPLPEDARLITAAPDLLDVVKRLMTLYTNFDGERPFGAITAVYDAARAAIAKAKGHE